MAQYISTNVTSLVAQSNLAKSSTALAGNLERLSSGQRINSASDDAAGMAIASRMTSQIRGNEMAKRNTADAISMVQTAEGAMGVQVEQLQRARELAVQSANGMLADSDRQKLDNEQDALIQEFDKVATETTFNENSLLDGSISAGVQFQVGANANETRIVDLVDTRAASLGGTESTTTSVAGATFNITQAAAITGGAAASTVLTQVGTDGSDFSGLMEIDNTNAATTGTTVKFSATATSLTNGESGTIQVTDANGETADLKITVTDATAKEFSVEYVDVAGTGSLASMDITTQTSANEAITTIDTALDSLQTARSDMGTYQNRFEQVSSNLDVSLANTSAARGRIQDADFAKETADMTKNQILSQAGVAMLSQANQLPQNVLSLLR
jgi:flagellin